MPKDIICVDGEIKSVSKEIDTYIKQQITAINSYLHNMRLVQMQGIKDELIRNELEEAAEKLTEYRQQLDLIRQGFSQTKSAYLLAFEKNDVFTFPVSPLSAVDAMIGMFS